MMSRSLLTFPLLSLYLLIGTGCANTDSLRKVVDNTIANEKLLRQHHFQTSTNLQKGIESLVKIEAELRILIPRQCTRLNAAAGSLVEEKANKLEYQYKLQFEQAANRILDTEFEERFTTDYLARLRKNYETRRNELDQLNGLLESARTTADTDRTLKLEQQVQGKRIEVLALVERSKSDELELRGILNKRVKEEREVFFVLVAESADKIRDRAKTIKNRSCSLASPQATEKKKDLETLKKELSAIEPQITNLYQTQEAALKVIKDYVNRISIFKLILAGLQEGVNNEIKASSEKVARLLDKVQKNSDKFIESAISKLDQTAATAKNLVNSESEKLNKKFEKSTADINSEFSKFLAGKI